jgi:hypothetical protein
VSEDAIEEVVAARLNRFYLDLQWALGEFIRQPKATPVGIGVIIKRVATAHGVEAASVYPLPRLTRAEEGERHNG